jgi:nucleoside transporter
MSTAPAVAMPTRVVPLVRTRLSVMMFLQYAIWGAWLPLLFPFMLGYRGLPIGEVVNILAAGAAGAIFAPFISGQLSDRAFNTERVLAVSHLIGAGLVWFLSTTTGYWNLMALAFAYSLVYSPTLSLTNSLALSHLPDRDKDFGGVRLWGTVGWIAAGIGIGQWLLAMHTPQGTAEEIAKAQNAGMADAFRLSAILGIIMGIYCLTLPSTPPAKGERSNAAFKAIGETLRQPLFTLFLLAIPMSCVHQFYFVHTSTFLGEYQRSAASTIDFINSIFGVGGGGLMTVGQMSEILVLALVPFVAKQLSRKSLLAIGIAAYALRMAIFAYAPVLLGKDSAALLPTLLVGVALHGLCFGCFIFVAFLVIDENTTKDVRASAQSLFGLVVFGIGIIIGSVVAGQVGEVAKVPNSEPAVFNYTTLFAYPMWAALACLILLLLLYPNRKKASIG